MKHTKQSIISKDGVSYLFHLYLLHPALHYGDLRMTLPIRW